MDGVEFVGTPDCKTHTTSALWQKVGSAVGTIYRRRSVGSNIIRRKWLFVRTAETPVILKESVPKGLKNRKLKRDEF